MDFVSFLSMIIYEVLYTYMMFKVYYLQRLVFRISTCSAKTFRAAIC